MTFNFQARFVPLIESGQKGSTIRAYRSDGKVCRPGEVMHLFTGMRTKQCRKIGDRVCLNARPIVIHADGTVWVDVLFLTRRLLNKVAITDGFANADDMLAWFRQNHKLPFMGHLYTWL
jgi:hypothetical protein